MTEGAKEEAKIEDVATVLILDGGNYAAEGEEAAGGERGEFVVELYRLDLFCLYIALQSLLDQNEMSSDHAVLFFKEVAKGWATKNSIEGNSDNPLDSIYDYLSEVDKLAGDDDIERRLYEKGAEIFAKSLHLGQEQQKQYADLVAHSIAVYYEMLSKVASDYRLVA